jgi:hypothetical protein
VEAVKGNNSLQTYVSNETIDVPETQDAGAEHLAQNVDTATQKGALHAAAAPPAAVHDDEAIAKQEYNNLRRKRKKLHSELVYKLNTMYAFKFLYFSLRHTFSKIKKVRMSKGSDDEQE